jgi:hypothetical protein
MAYITDIDPRPGEWRTRHAYAAMFDHYSAALSAGYWLVDKARRQAADLGTQAAAHNLRKQGVPIEVALAILAAR